MIIKNVNIYTEDKTFVHGDIFIENGKFVSECADDMVETDDIKRIDDIKEMDSVEVIDGENCYAIPGLIDIHFHGCMGYDFCDGTKEAIHEIAKYQAAFGVTMIAPATMTLPVEELEHILSVAAGYKESDDSGARLVGINMEGPFISPVKKGAQDAKNIIPCSVEVADRFLKASKGLVKFIGIAPEEHKESVNFIKEMKERVNISLAHTNADYETAKAAFDAGANHAVHLFNAMPAFSHREPGVIGAVADSEHVMAELICDGIHIHPSVVRSAFKMLGEDRILFISDSMRATGLTDGVYTLGGLDVRVEGSRATLVSDGALAGSVTNLLDCMRIAVKKMDIPLNTAIACATMNPAKSLGMYDRVGSISNGKIGNVVLLNQDLSLRAVIKEGKMISLNLI